MHLTVNGKPRDVDADREIALPALLTLFEVNPRLVAVAINGDVIPKTQFDVTVVRAGDELEIVRMVGGGAR